MTRNELVNIDFSHLLSAPNPTVAERFREAYENNHGRISHDELETILDQNNGIVEIKSDEIQLAMCPVSEGRICSIQLVSDPQSDNEVRVCDEFSSADDEESSLKRSAKWWLKPVGHDEDPQDDCPYSPKRINYRDSLE